MKFLPGDTELNSRTVAAVEDKVTVCLFLLHLDMLIYVRHKINAYSSNVQEKYSTLYSVKTCTQTM